MQPVRVRGAHFFYLRFVIEASRTLFSVPCPVIMTGVKMVEFESFESYNNGELS